MATYIPKLVDVGFQNWIKVNLALNITKEGTENCVLNEIYTFHQAALNDILSPEQILNHDLCSQCKNENIFPCPTRGICIVKTGLCSFHYTQQKRYRPCPKHICDRLREKIKQCHKYNFPSWKNTKAEDWCQNPWELAKCFLPPDGYLGVSSIEETDINGIVSVIMNHSAFKNKVDMRNCNEVREVARRVRHSPDICINDQDLHNFLDTLVTFLSCSSLFQGDLKAAASVQKITKLKTDSLTIRTNDVTKVLQAVIHENTRRSLQVVNERLAKQAHEIEADLHKLEQVASKSIKDIFTAKVAAIDDIESTRRTTIDDIKSTAEQLKSELKTDIVEAKVQAVAEIEDLKNTSVKSEYQHLKADFKSDLLSFNQQYHSTIPLSSVFEEHDTHLQNFYVQPAMNSIEVQKTTLSGSAVEVRNPIKSLQDVFCKKAKHCANIYLTSGAGQGKTVFCKHLVVTWCHAHRNQSIESELFVEDVQVMKDFEYIFLLSLRNSTVQCDVDDMIESQIVQNLAQNLKYTPEFMQTLLNREKCLILLDGLDEWSHPEPSVTTCTKTRDGLPHRKARQNCTILTTTRSWKLSSVNLQSSQIDNHIEIGYLDDDSSRQLIANAVRKILVQDDKTGTSVHDETFRQIENITVKINSRSTPEFEMNPLILTYMIGLVCDGNSLGQSKCQLYANIIDFLLHRWEKRTTEIAKAVSADKAFDTSLLPAIFRNCGHVKKYEKYFLSLGQLAFKALFCESKERSLVFGCSLMDSCLTEDEQKFCLSTGLLIQNKLPGRLTTNEVSVSFPHKTFQEFFASMYIYADLSVVKEPVLEKCNSVENILAMSNVYIFLSGLCPDQLCVLLKDFSKIINDDSMIIQFRSEKVTFFFQDTAYGTVRDLQDMYIACVKESENANHESVCPLLQDIIIDRDRKKEGYIEMLQKLTRTSIENIKSIWLTHCESEMDTQKLIRKLNLKKIHTLESLQLLCPIVTENLEQILAGSVNTLKQLTSYSLLWNNGSLLTINSSLSDISIKLIREMNFLTSLNLSNFGVSHCLLESLLSHLTKRTSMKQIMLIDITCLDHGELCPGFSMDLSRHVQLISTGLSGIPLIHVQINTSALETCFAGPLKTSSSFSSFIKCLPDAKKIKVFICFSLQNEIDLSNMMETIPQLINIKELAVIDADLKNKVLKLSSDSASIEHILMQNITMTSSSLEQLVQQVDRLQQSVQIDLTNCTVTPAEENMRITFHIKSSGRFEVICDGEEENIYGMKLNSFTFRTIRN